MNCVMCGKPVAGEGNICASCLEEVRQPTTSFSPVTSNAQEPAEANRASGAPRPYCLLVIKGPHISERFYLEDNQMSIGRNPQAELFLNDRTVSRDHAVIKRQGDAYTIQDAGSLNGTYVNDNIVDSAELEEGDVVQIGTFQMLFTSYPEENGLR
ncbi:MAG: FHA domain-containing protein [Coriobacteriia bacterium]|nr:FHA domain-containing protein [Coriobacteriia bacterium]